MGRPRKRQKIGNSPSNGDTIPPATTILPSGLEHQPPSGPSQAQPAALPPPASESAIDPELSSKEIERAHFENICNGPISQTIKHRAAQNFPPSSPCQTNRSGNGNNLRSQGSNSTSSDDAPRTPSDGDAVSNVFYPTDISQWPEWVPDFGDMTMLPMPVQDSHEHNKDSHSHDPNLSTYQDTQPYDLLSNRAASITQLPSIPACPCLPNMYLTLSTLSTLSAFPISSGTIDTLLSAQRTGHAVIYCDVCPQKMQSGAQNVMMSSMLITVLADHWHRVRKAGAQELKIGFSNSEIELDGEDNAEISGHKDLEWRTFGHQLVRAYVFGDTSVATPVPPNKNQNNPVLHRPPPPSQIVTLSSLVSALERRQKQWHDVDPTTGEFPPKLQPQDLPRGYTSGMTLDDIQRCEEAEMRKSRQDQDVDGHGTGTGTGSASEDDGILCLRLVKHARMMMGSLDVGAPQLDGGAS